ncbi:condensation domain-containing protein [Amycolatopsis kentuckyensis]|uniref:condensation domain-containing protein n=1 Tax=Amycolatopsis kentuckyensis TaxID=218823 RepID=UPI0013029CAE|nr:condensation domain-containing protein [Amycolatopsis kentuckyensis]
MKRFELNYAQRRSLYRTPAREVYTITVAVEPPAGTTEQAARAALDELVAAHEALRSRLVFTRDGRPLQEVTEARDGVEVVLQPIRHSGEIPDTAVAEPAPVDPRTHAGRCRLYTLDGSVRSVVLTVTHLFADGVSQGVLYRDLTALLRGERLPGTANRRQASDYADPLLAATTRENTEFWKRRLADAPRACTFGGYSRTSEEELQIARRADDRVQEAVMAAAREVGASAFTVWATALSALVSVYTGQDRQVFRSVSANRLEPADEEAVANLAQPVYIRLDGEQRDTLRHRAELVLEASIDAHTRGVFDAAELLAWLDSPGVRRGVAFRPAFDLNFLVHDDGMRAPTGDYVQRRRVVPARATADLAVQVQQGPTTHVRVTAGEPIWTARAAGAIATDLSGVLRLLRDRPDLPVHDLPLARLRSASLLQHGHPSGIGIDDDAQRALLTGVAGVRSASWTALPAADGMRVLAAVETEGPIDADALARFYTGRQPWICGAVVPDRIEAQCPEIAAAKETMR